MVATPKGALSARRLEMVGALAVIALGLPLHFAYSWAGGSHLVGVLAPVNESVWEHLKLVVVPVTMLGVAEMRWTGDWDRLWWAKLREVAVACAFIVGFFYTYTGAFGVRSVTAVDIASFFLAVGLGQWTSYRRIVSSAPAAPLWMSVAGMTLVFVVVGVLTFAPPHIPLFQEISTGAYGPT